MQVLGSGFQVFIDYPRAKCRFSYEEGFFEEEGFCAFLPVVVVFAAFVVAFFGVRLFWLLVPSSRMK